VISDEPFWQNSLAGVIPTLRLRAAYGQTGRSPTAGASLETFYAQPFAIYSSGTATGVVPLNPGNQELRPERGTEIEAGFDAGFFQDRFGLEVTYFNKRTTDLLLQVPVPPSSGYIPPAGLGTADVFPFRNIGEVLNEGWEFAVRGALVATPNFGWDVRVSGNTLHNELIDLGEVDPFGTIWRFTEGRQLGAFHTQRIRSIDPATKRVVVSDTLEFVGNNLPTFEGSANSTWTLFQNVQVSGLLDWKTGFMVYNNTAQFRDRAFLNSELAHRPSLISEEEHLRRYGNNRAFVSEEDGATVAYTQVNEEYFEDGDFLRLREVAATFTLPSNLARRVGASAASLTIGGRNLALWSKYSGNDPEMLAQATRNAGAATFEREDFLTVPQPRRFVAKLNFSF
jgi:hypothetical protein